MLRRTRSNAKKVERRITASYKERLNKTSTWKRTQMRRAPKVNYFRKDEGETICYYFSQDKIITQPI